MEKAGSRRPVMFTSPLLPAHFLALCRQPSGGGSNKEKNIVQEDRTGESSQVGEKRTEREQ